MIDYIDEDVAYLIGLIIGRGRIIENDNDFTIVIEFPFRDKILEGVDQFKNFVFSISTTMIPRLSELLGTSSIIFNTDNDNEKIHLKIELNKNNMIVRNIKLILDNRLSYSEYRVPDIIKSSGNKELIKEFIRGFADVSANIRSSNADQNGFHRVYMDILFKNWHLPVEICNLLQDELNVNVANILWSHPNLRGSDSTNIGREHQIRIYAHEFLKLGFYITHKQEILKQLAEENIDLMKKIHYNPSRRCDGCSRQYRTKPHSPFENDERLPPEVRGKHFNMYWEICAEFGCKKAEECVKERRRMPLFEEEDNND